MHRPNRPADESPQDASTAQTLAWLALLALTLVSLGLGEWLRGAPWLPLPVALPVAVAAIVWLKGRLVARHFIESHLAHRLIARSLQVFVAFVPLALLLTAFFGDSIARWATLH